MPRSLLVVFVWMISAPGLYAQEGLDERLRAAEASRTVREAFFAGRGEPPLTMTQAFPHLAGEPIGDPARLDAWRDPLDSRRDARARELFDASEARLESLRRVHAAEAASDALEAQLLDALAIGLERAPGFAEAALSEAPLGEDAADARRRLRSLQRAALRRMTVPGDTTLAELVDTELATGAATALARDRLERALPLLDAERASRVRAALGADETEAPAAVEPPRPSPPTPSENAPTTTLENIRSAIADLRASEGERRDAVARRLADFETRAVELESELAAIEMMSVLSESRRRRQQTTLAAANELVRAIRSELRAIGRLRQAHAVEAGRLLSDLQPERPSVSEADAMVELRETLDARERTTRDSLAALLAVDVRALAVRRALPSLDVAPGITEAFGSELRAELSDAPLWLEFEVRDEVRRLRSLPERARNLTSLYELLRLSFDLLLLGLVWIYVRKQAPRWLRRVPEAMQKREPVRFGLSRRFDDVSNEDLETLGRYATDALGALILHRLLLPRSELLALATLLWIGFAIAHAIPAAVRLLLPFLGRVLDPLETERGLTTEIRARAEKTAKWFLWWWIVSRVLEFVSVPLLQADRLLQLVEAVSVLVLLLLVVIWLWTWSPWIRQFIANLADQSALTGWLGRPLRSKSQRVLRAAAGAVYIVLRLVFWALVDRGWLARPGTNVALSQVRVVDAETELVSGDERESIRNAERSDILRTKELEAVTSALGAWHREQRRGVVAVIGDRGMGKSVFLDQFEKALPDTGLELAVTRLSAPRIQSRRLRDRLSWLSEPLGLEIPKNATKASVEKGVVEQLETRPSQVIVVDDMHLLLRRTVSGLEVLEAVLNIIHACSDEHFWLLAFHRPAWRYIEGALSSIEVGFRERVDLLPLDPDELGERLVMQTVAAGYSPEFRRLLSGRRPHAEQDALELKAKRLYWRIVSQASLGNPLVMSEYWLSSLGAPTGDGSRTLPVYLYAGPADSEVSGMSDGYLFLLTALLVHDGLSVEVLADVLNIARSEVRMTCRHLESLGIVRYQSPTYVITPRWQPSVFRVLDRRNFVHD